MNSLPQSKIESIRNAKREGMSLQDISKTFGCSKSTASLYCRDLFYHPSRKYNTEEQARQIPIERRKGKLRRRYPSDYNRKRKLYSCVSCGNLISRKGHLCLKCYTAKLIEATNQRIAHKLVSAEERRKRRLERSLPPVEIEVCPSPKSPNQRHFWFIDSQEHGVCHYCGEKRDFTYKTKRLQPIF